VCLYDNFHYVAEIYVPLSFTFKLRNN